MNPFVDYNEDEYDLLKEVFNMAMGQTGKDLAMLLKVFVDLSVPDIKIVPAEKVISTVINNFAFHEDELITAVRQTFYNTKNKVEGETITLFNDSAFATVANMLGFEDVKNSAGHTEMFLDMANIISGVSMNGFSKQLLGNEMVFTPPSILNQQTEAKKLIYDIFMRSHLKWDYTLLVKIKFSFQQNAFKSDLLILMSEKSIETVRESLDKQLSDE